METTVYNQKGETMGKITLPVEIFGAKWKPDLVHQVVTSMLSSSRRGTAHTKTRGEVRGGGIKPWRQKGTGRARHGSSRSPIWVGGGITHGPRNEKNYDRKVNRRMKTQALFSILSKKMQDGEIAFIDDLKFTEPKTKNAVEIISKLKKIENLNLILNKKENSAVIAMGETNPNATRSFRNIGNIAVEEARSLNPVSLLKYRGLVFVNPEASLRALTGRFGSLGSSEIVEKEAPKTKKKSVRKVSSKNPKPKAKK